MSWTKIFFGEDDKKKKDAHSENPLQNEQLHKGSVGMKPLDNVHVKRESLEESKDIIQSLEKSFQSMDQPNGAVKPNGATQPKGTVKPNDATQPNGTVKANGVNQPWGFYGGYIPKILDVDTKLTVILIENTEDVAKEKDKLEAIVKKIVASEKTVTFGKNVTSGKVCVINYGSLVREGKVINAKDFDCSELICEEDIGANACLFDALIALEGVVEENYKKTEELKNKRIRTKEIEIIGIGRCVDNCSISSREIAIESFCRVAKYRDVTTKYFCLSEESFVDTATIGFHSIGAIARNYM